MLDLANHTANDGENLRSLIAADAEELSKRLQAHQLRTFPPTAEKGIRLFNSGEAAEFIGIHEGYLRQVVAEGHGPQPQPNGRRLYSVDDIEKIREVLDQGGAKGSKKYIRHRTGREKLQIIGVSLPSRLTTCTSCSRICPPSITRWASVSIPAQM